jgi:hypothetical protein
MRPVLMGKPWVVVANRRRARHSVDFPGITEHCAAVLLQGVNRQFGLLKGVTEP